MCPVHIYHTFHPVCFYRIYNGLLIIFKHRHGNRFSPYLSRWHYSPRNPHPVSSKRMYNKYIYEQNRGKSESENRKGYIWERCKIWKREGRHTLESALPNYGSQSGREERYALCTVSAGVARRLPASAVITCEKLVVDNEEHRRLS